MEDHLAPDRVSLEDSVSPGGCGLNECKDKVSRPGQARNLGHMTSVVERLRRDRPVFSVECLPPRDAEDEQRLWRTIRELEALDPAFVSITYGAGGSSRDRTIRTTGRVAQETTLVPLAHLTAVNHSVAELRNVIGWYAAVGVRNILAIRGDPPGDPMGEWITHPEGLTYAEENVAHPHRRVPPDHVTQLGHRV